MVFRVKIKVKKMSYEQVLNLPKEKFKKPKKPKIIFRILLKMLSLPDLLATDFKCYKIGMEKLDKNEPCLVLMNHSSFIDLKIATSVWFPKPLNIVCTYDGFVGKRWLMKNLGCMPTKKFINDSKLVKDMFYALKKLKSSVLLFPEAGYSFDGRATVLPESLGKCIKFLDVPVVMIKTKGAFLRDPLYNGLQLRKVKVSAQMEYILSRNDIKEKSVAQINEIIQKEFDFDGFKIQQENNISVNEKFRADGLHRVLYRCPHCEKEGTLLGKGIELACSSCNSRYTLTEYGYLENKEGNSIFNHIPNWFDWQRECVKKEILNGEYNTENKVNIVMLVNTRCLYDIGKGVLIHNSSGFKLTDENGNILFEQTPSETYCVNADYFWYEIGDIVCIGDSKALYYCFPEDKNSLVTKIRIATEELYKISKAKREGALF